MRTATLKLDKTSGTPDSNKRIHLFSQGIDFFLLGGGSFLLLVAARYLLGLGEAESITITLIAANLINHPHFAHSYIIFYRDFARNARSSHIRTKIRYLTAGILVLLGLISFFVIAISIKSPKMLSLSINLMFFTVGWHYVKQGYGLLIVDSVLKNSSFSSNEKTSLLVNAYATWALAWCLVNTYISNTSKSFFGFTYNTFSIPDTATKILAIICIATGANIIVLITKKINKRDQIPWSGFFGYIASLYPWLLWRDPIMLLWYPMLHSLQYLAVAWRLEFNKINTIKSQVRPSLRFGLLISTAMAIGYFGFLALPELLSKSLGNPDTVFGPTLYISMVWIFINIHHYFIDSAMWRKENRETFATLYAKT